MRNDVKEISKTKVFYQNVRRLKSEIDALDEAIDILGKRKTYWNTRI